MPDGPPQEESGNGEKGPADEGRPLRPVHYSKQDRSFQEAEKVGLLGPDAYVFGEATTGAHVASPKSAWGT
jgi:hypothetical protein